MSRTYTLTPAYGRDYTSARDAKAAFLAGKDWVLQPEGVYCSVHDLPPGASVHLRYARLTRVAVLKIPANGGET